MDMSTADGARDDRPNVILINCDDLGYGDLACYGSTVNHTPTIDRLASEGILLTNFYAASSVCSPSRAALLTGCYPPRVGFGDFDGEAVLWPGDASGLSSEEMTLGRMLKDRGYATSMIGKWHCGDQPEFLPRAHGFDHFFGLPYSNDMAHMTTRPTLPPLPLILDDDVVQEQPDQTSLTERYVDEAVRFIRRNKSSPFFLYLAHMYVHLPLYVPEAFLAQSENGAYGAAVAAIDWSTSVILNELEQLGLSDNTIVIFTSDNGSTGLSGGSNGPLRGRKGTNFEGGVRVPCVVRWPAEIPPASVSDQPVSAIDLLPTLAAAAGVSLPNDRIIDGRDVSPLLKRGVDPTLETRSLFFYYKDQLEAVRRGRWKLHVRNDEVHARALYDLDLDVAERHDVAADHPGIVAELEAELARCRADLGDSALAETGSNRRAAGRVDHPDTLTHHDTSHPYLVAMYDLEGDIRYPRDRIS